MHVFGNLGKYQKFKTFIQYLKFITRHNYNEILTTFVLKIAIFHNFLVNLNILLQKYGTNQCLFRHSLKHSVQYGWGKKKPDSHGFLPGILTLDITLAFATASL